ncbi:hypothetical protein [Sulfitobacter sp. F26169L]|uniref:hypothetical protein n=1 Tax=Sulfitobacter sp. F26169L TaxID=2996015 RepID=UPI002260BD2D|nr:hypothetical protein [Sulfitobacter sp. F26169L]
MHRAASRSDLKMSAGQIVPKFRQVEVPATQDMLDLDAIRQIGEKEKSALSLEDEMRWNGHG